jgi:ribonuclease HI
MVQPFFRLASRVINKPPTFLVQTDGSFHEGARISKTAAIAFQNPLVNHMKIWFDHESSYESEWASVLEGLRMSQSLGIDAVELENDNLSVMTYLRDKRIPGGPMAATYYKEILEESAKMEWVGIRWIPRERNFADTLFRGPTSK